MSGKWQKLGIWIGQMAKMMIFASSLLICFWPAFEAEGPKALNLTLILFGISLARVLSSLLPQQRMIALQRAAALAQRDLVELTVTELQFAVLSFGADLRIKLVMGALPQCVASFHFGPEDSITSWIARLMGLADEPLRSLQFQIYHAFGMDHIQWNILSLQLPKEVSLAGLPSSYVRFRFVPKFHDGKLVSVLVIMQDISELKEREGQAQQQRKEMEKVFAVLHVSDSLFELFMSEARKLFDEIKSDLRLLREHNVALYNEIAIRMFRAIHTIKANARLFNLHSIEDVSHEVEYFLDDLRTGKRAFTNDAISDLAQKIHLISEEVYSYATMRKELQQNTEGKNNFQIKYRVQWIRSLMNQFAAIMRDPKFEQRHLTLIQKEFSRALLSFDKSSLRDYVRGYNQMIHDVAHKEGKIVEDLHVDLEYHHFDSAMLARINDILLHCLRNAIDHGIESAEERLRNGKVEPGRVSLKTRDENGVLYLEVSDNGRGIDLEKIRQRAMDLGLIHDDEERPLTEAEVLTLLFKPGVSTATEVTETSGRGLGMDIIRDYVQGLNGQITVKFVKGQGTTVAMWIPTANQEMLTPHSIVNLKEVFSEILAEFPRFAPLVNPHLVHLTDKMIVFADRLILVEIIRTTFAELYHSIPAQVSVQFELVELPGRRRVDSFNFFRLRMGAFDNGDGLPGVHEIPVPLEIAGNLARKAGGSIFLHQPYWVELNLPSNIPVKFADYEFKVLLFMDRISNLSQTVDHFFATTMGGWKYRVHRFPFEPELLHELNDVACLILLDSQMIRAYLDFREESNRVRDGVVLFPEDELDVDALNESSILPENLLFVPPAFDEKNLHRCLAGVIFRRFLREMVREPMNFEQNDGSESELQAS